MAAPLPFTESELRLLGVLLKRKVRFMIVGLSAATLQGAQSSLRILTCGSRIWANQKVFRRSIGSANVGLLRHCQEGANRLPIPRRRSDR